MRLHSVKNVTIFLLIVLLAAGLVGTSSIVRAQNADQLREKIDEQQGEIEKIEQEIKEYERELIEIGREKQTLEGAVRELDVSRQKVNASISLTQRQINDTSSTIGELEDQIEDKESRIAINRDGVAEALRRMHEAESDSFVEVILGSDDISDLWSDVETLRQLQVVMRGEVKELSARKLELEAVKGEKEEQQGVLVSQKTQLSTQQRSLDINRRAKNDLLNQTKNRESSYQDLIEEKRQARIEFESQLREFEAQLQYTLDPTSVPPIGKGVLSWPLANVTITQYFGNTKFAQSGAYNGRGHNGVDFRAAIGTPIKAALSGNVVATGNTDRFRGCYSYGKWVLLEHVNGLSTLYAHLSDIDVTVGEPVATGEVIGYSGNTGYSTGPHLHFSVFAADAVEIVRLGDIKTRTNCADAHIPVAPWSAYLNPLNYL